MAWQSRDMCLFLGLGRNIVGFQVLNILRDEVVLGKLVTSNWSDLGAMVLLGNGVLITGFGNVSSSQATDLLEISVLRLHELILCCILLDIASNYVFLKGFHGSTEYTTVYYLDLPECL
ncbi:hypothetical protein ACJX0J_008225, partial [Zea mays]